MYQKYPYKRDHVLSEIIRMVLWPQASISSSRVHHLVSMDDHNIFACSDHIVGPGHKVKV